jgi:hypothetical protein
MSAPGKDSEALACGNLGTVLYVGFVRSAVIINRTSWRRFGKAKGSLENTQEFIVLLAIAAGARDTLFRKPGNRVPLADGAEAVLECSERRNVSRQPWPWN